MWWALGTIKQATIFRPVPCLTGASGGGSGSNASHRAEDKHNPDRGEEEGRAYVGFLWVKAAEQPALKKWCFYLSLKDMPVSEEDHVVTCIPAKATAPSKILGQRQSKD